MAFRIIFFLQSLQSVQPPSLISIHLLQGLVSVRIVYIRVHLSTPVRVVQSETEVIAEGDSFFVQSAIHCVADDRGSNGLLAVYDEINGSVINIHQEVICAMRERRVVTRHGFHGLRRVPFE
jgi:hypothetical protein